MVLPRMVATPSDMFRKFKALFSMQDQYTYTEARLQAISEELGRNFRAAYTNPAVEWDEWNQAHRGGGLSPTLPLWQGLPPLP
jgi:hypothetical protein